MYNLRVIVILYELSSPFRCGNEAMPWFSSFSVQGNWTRSSTWNTIPDPMNGESFIKVAEVHAKEIQVGSLSASHYLVTFCIVLNQ